MRWRSLADDGASASAGLATDEALMAAYHRGEPERPPTLRLYTYASHAALCGRYQHLTAEIDTDACERTQTRYNRRPTGGGAIVMGEGQLGVAMIDRARPAERPKETIERLAGGIQRGLAELGIDASFRGKNDLEVAGRKIAGLGLYLDDGGGQLFHASVLADLDVPFMLEVLRIPAAKLGDKAVAAVSERVTTVTGETGEAWTGARLRDVIAIGFEKAFDVRLEASTLTDAESASVRELEERKYLDRGWLFQRSPGDDVQGTALLKTAAGLVRVYVAIDDGVVKSALFAGDFNTLPPELGELESALKWTRAERAAGVVERAWPAESTLGVDASTIASAVSEAVQRAAARTASAPARDGSCYFPEVS